MFRYDPYWKEIASFRALYDTIVALKPEAVPDYLLGPGVEAARPLMATIEPYKRRDFPGHSYTFPEGGRWDDLWHLYAMSRISDHLLIPLQPLDPGYAGPHVNHWLAPLLPPIPLDLPEHMTDLADFLRALDSHSHKEVSRADLLSCFPYLTADVYLRFFEALGFEHLSEPAYSPFYHEAVEVEEIEGESGGVEIVREFWPGLRLGEMMFARAGVSVRCSPAVMRKAIAERSTLYWAHKRLRRRVFDLSVGWGHNSEWATEFRRDYEDDERFYFNAGDKIDIGDLSLDQQDAYDLGASLPIQARQELLIHRCFVRTPEPPPEREPWPWDDTLTVRKHEPYWLP
jgi:hypothetical protein